MVIENRSKDDTRGGADKDYLAAYDIDVFWLQREVGKAYKDAITQSAKTKEAEQIMTSTDETGEEKPLREIENDLMELFDYEQPDLVGKLVKNKDKIIWMLRWQRVAEDAPARSTGPHS